MSATVEYSQELLDYMGRKGMSDVLVEMVQPKCCCGSMPERSVRLIGAQHAARLREGGASRLTGSVGDVFLGRARIPERGVVRLGMKRRPLGLVEVTVEGLVDVPAV